MYRFFLLLKQIRMKTIINIYYKGSHPVWRPVFFLRNEEYGFSIFYSICLYVYPYSGSSNFQVNFFIRIIIYWKKVDHFLPLFWISDLSDIILVSNLSNFCEQKHFIIYNTNNNICISWRLWMGHHQFDIWYKSFGKEKAPSWVI